MIDSQFSTVICAPVFSQYTGLSSQVPVGTQEGLKHESAIHCDQLISLPKARLTDFIGSLGQTDLAQVNQALRIALAVE